MSERGWTNTARACIISCCKCYHDGNYAVQIVVSVPNCSCWRSNIESEEIGEYEENLWWNYDQTTFIAGKATPTSLWKVHAVITVLPTSKIWSLYLFRITPREEKLQKVDDSLVMPGGNFDDVTAVLVHIKTQWLV